MCTHARNEDRAVREQLTVRVPAALARDLGLHEGDRVELRRVEDRLIIERPAGKRLLAITSETGDRWTTGGRSRRWAGGRCRALGMKTPDRGDVVHP